MSTLTKPDYKKIGNRIKQVRLARNINRKKAAEDLGYSEEHLRRIERGARKIEYDFILSVANYYGVNDIYLLKGDEFEMESQRELLLKARELIDKAIELASEKSSKNEKQTDEIEIEETSVM